MFSVGTDNKRLVLARAHVGLLRTELLELKLADASIRKLPFDEDAKFPVISAKGDRIAYETGAGSSDLGSPQILVLGAVKSRFSGIRINAVDSSAAAVLQTADQTAADPASGLF